MMLDFQIDAIHADIKTKDMINKDRSTYATHDSQGVSLEVYPDSPGTYMIINTESVEFDSLIEAMKFQAAKNKEICDEIIKKEKAFRSSLKFNKPNQPWDWRK